MNFFLNSCLKTEGAGSCLIISGFPILLYVRITISSLYQQVQHNILFPRTQDVLLNLYLVCVCVCVCVCVRARTHTHTHTHKKQVWTTRITSYNRTPIYCGNTSALLYYQRISPRMAQKGHNMYKWRSIKQRSLKLNVHLLVFLHSGNFLFKTAPCHFVSHNV
jgi:hypothetical protein